MNAAAITGAHQQPDAAAAQRRFHALAKQVPDMARGFTIQTSFGDIHIEAGPAAERIRQAVKDELLRGVST